MKTGILPTDTAYLNAVEIENCKYPEKLARIPRSQWPNKDRADKIGMLEVWRSRGFLVQVYEKKEGVTRLSICRTRIDQQTGRWVEGITWDELMQLKRECGFGDSFAVEVFPEDAHVINVANMRHLWILPEAMSFAWRKS